MQQGEGSVQMGAFRDYNCQHGTATMAPSDVEQIFRNIDTGNNNLVRRPQPLLASRHLMCKWLDVYMIAVPGDCRGLPDLHGQSNSQHG